MFMHIFHWCDNEMFSQVESPIDNWVFDTDLEWRSHGMNISANDSIEKDNWCVVRSSQCFDWEHLEFDLARLWSQKMLSGELVDLINLQVKKVSKYPSLANWHGVWSNMLIVLKERVKMSLTISEKGSYGSNNVWRGVTERYRACKCDDKVPSWDIHNWSITRSTRYEICCIR